MQILPTQIMIEMSSVCNLRCGGCPNTFIKRESRYIDKETFLNIFKKYGNTLNKVLLWNYGEPLLHPLIEELIEGIKDTKCKKILSTNGMNLIDFKSLDFLSNIDEIIISVNGCDQKTYEYHQRGGNLKKVIKGIKKLSDTLENKKTKIIMQSVINKKNFSQIPQLKRLAKRTGCHEFRIKLFNVMDGKKNTFAKFVPNNEFSKYSTNREYKFDNTVKNNLRKVIGLNKCQASFVINSDGTCNLCCWDYGSKYIFGKMNKRSDLLDVWNSKKAKKYREMAKNKKLSICQNCPDYSIMNYKRFLLK